MKNFLSKVFIVLIAILFLSLTACQSSNEIPQDDVSNELQEEVEKKQEVSQLEPSTTLQVSEESDPQKDIEPDVSSEPNEETPKLAIVFPDDVLIVNVSQNYNGDEETLTLKGDLLQFWINQDVVCEKQIPTPAEMSVGSNFYEMIGNPYISEDGSLVLMQSYTTSEGKKVIDYKILATNCRRIISSLSPDGYVFQTNSGEYGLIFCKDYPSFIGFPYEGFYFTVVDDYFPPLEPELIWLDESTVKLVSFGCWGTTSYGYQDISSISVRLEVKSYGSLDISSVSGYFTPVEVDDEFFDFLYEKFPVEEYNERFLKVIQMLNEYRQKN